MCRYITTSITVVVPVNNTLALLLRHCDDAGCDRLATRTSTITHRTLCGATKKRYILEDRSRDSCCLLWPGVTLLLYSKSSFVKLDVAESHCCAEIMFIMVSDPDLGRIRF